MPNWDKHKDINEPTQKAIIAYKDGHEDLILQVKYNGPVEQFGWLIPVPNVPTVKRASMDCFYELSKFTQMLWEPLVPQGRGGPSSHGPSSGGSAVKVIEVKTVGAYQVGVLSAKDTGALEGWLTASGFSYPQEKADVVESYVKRGWYFVAAKIDLRKTNGFSLVPSPGKSEAPAEVSLEQKLASGELHPLHLSFASEKCIFPLRISSANGKASEVQVYVLSPQPLVEAGMFERKLPEIYSNDVFVAEGRARSHENLVRGGLRRLYGSTNFDLPADLKDEIRQLRESIRQNEDPPHYARVTNSELPDCGREISALAQGPCWLTKETWTFQPEEMRDLEFEPAIPVFAAELASKYGYYAAPCLTQFGSDALPEVLAALQSTNRAVRSAMKSAFEDAGYVYTEQIRRDPKFKEAVTRMITNADPEIRLFRLQNMEAAPSVLIAAMRDEDGRVASMAGASMMWDLQRGEGTEFIPAVKEMLKSANADTRLAALWALSGTYEEIPREKLLPFLSSSNFHAAEIAFQMLGRGDRGISNDDAALMLKNSNMQARLMGLRTLYENHQKSSVELALPLLKDPEKMVVYWAARNLRALTGQHFTAEQADQWQAWWSKNKAHFTVQTHPEELNPTMSLKIPPR